MGTLLYVLAVLVIAPSYCHLQEECSSLTSCSQCLTVPSCVWCSSPAASVHCLSRATANSMCSNASHIVDQQGNITINTLPLDENNQVSVSSVKMKLRIGEPQSFTVSVRAAENYPLDLYILMDSSLSFQTEINDLKRIAPQIVDGLRNMTAMFRVGLGLFVDKSVAPFNAIVALNLGFTVGNQPSACSHMLCRRPFSYNHVVNFTNSTEMFNVTIQDLLPSTSADTPEGTLDAMMQAVVCTNVVEWRDEARKVLLVLTDATMHTAGDGRLAGIYRPNDGQCHTQFDSKENGIYYSDSAEYDYPSLEQMKMILDRFQVIPVFAVNEELSYLFFPSAGFMVEEVYDFVRLLDVIERAYYRLINTAQLDFPNRDYLNVNIVPICPAGSTSVSNGCTGVANNTSTFYVNVTLTHCPDKLLNSGREVITAVIKAGFGAFNLELEGHCSCDDIATNLSCSNNSCPIGPNGLTCNGRGNCVCGQCVCHQPNMTYPGVLDPSIFGAHCECDNFMCDRAGPGKLVCNGQGICECLNGEYSCSCNASTTTGLRSEGTACQCSYDNCLDSTDSCHSSSSSKMCLCNGHGTCNPCSSPQLGCDCHTGFYGRFCQYQQMVQCSACNLDCVLCYAREGDNLTAACDRYQCAGYTVLNEHQPDGYQITGSIPNTTISCTFISEGGYVIYYYTAKGLSNGQLMHEIVPAISSAEIQNLPLPSLMVGLAIGLCLIILLFGITITSSCLVYFRRQRKQTNKNTTVPQPTELIMHPQAVYNLAQKGDMFHAHCKHILLEEEE